MEAYIDNVVVKTNVEENFIANLAETFELIGGSLTWPGAFLVSPLESSWILWSASMVSRLTLSKSTPYET
jgi:hypothetical protein